MHNDIDWAFSIVEWNNGDQLCTKENVETTQVWSKGPILINALIGIRFFWENRNLFRFYVQASSCLDALFYEKIPRGRKMCKMQQKARHWSCFHRSLKNLRALCSRHFLFSGPPLFLVFGSCILLSCILAFVKTTKSRHFKGPAKNHMPSTFRIFIAT